MDSEHTYTSQEVHQEIDRYLREEMASGEQLAFEKRLQNEPELAHEVEQLKLAKQAAEAFWELKLTRELGERGKNLLKEGHGREMNASNPIFLRVAVAAGVLIFLSIGLKWYANTYFSTSALISSHYQAKRTPTFLSDANKRALSDGFAAYRERNYPQAISIFQNISLADASYSTAQMYLGYSYFESGDFQKAASAFGQVIQTGDSRYLENAQWNQFLAISMEKGNFMHNSGFLEEIAKNPQHSFSKQALVLNKKLNNPLRRIASF